MPAVAGDPESPRAGSAKKLLDKFEELSPSTSPEKKRGSASPRKPPVKDIDRSMSFDDNPIVRKDRLDKKNARKAQGLFGSTFGRGAIIVAAVAVLGFGVLPMLYFGRQAGGSLGSILTSLGV
mmetsp:Transcript_5176/g.10149  ORF Transcript_5176/g.10149 Transcript_5176/m.10149 type:complete len:123 (+) Transcript_5176:102-470(+)